MPGKSVQPRKSLSCAFCSRILSAPRWTIPPALPHFRKPDAKLVPSPVTIRTKPRAAVVQGLQSADRGQLIMACGTGKNCVTLWIKEQLAVQTTLVLVPSLGLLSA